MAALTQQEIDAFREGQMGLRPQPSVEDHFAAQNAWLYGYPPNAPTYEDIMGAIYQQPGSVLTNTVNALVPDRQAPSQIPIPFSGDRLENETTGRQMIIEGAAPAIAAAQFFGLPASILGAAGNTMGLKAMGYGVPGAALYGATLPQIARAYNRLTPQQQDALFTDYFAQPGAY